MRVLLVHGLLNNGPHIKVGAVEYHRMQKPHQALFRHGVEFNTTNYIDNVPDEVIKTFDLVLFSRVIVNPDKTPKRLRALGVPFGLDLDDYWNLPEEHILFKEYEKHETPLLIKLSVKEAGFVLVTTSILADKVKALNENVHVIENGIDDLDPVWQPKKIESKRIRYGFTQGSTHMPDLFLIAEDVAMSLYDPFFAKDCQVVLTGFKAELGKGSIYIGYEKILTDELRTIDHNREYCRKLKKLQFPNGNSYPYKRVQGLDVDQFARVYNEMDIVVAPLKESIFNSCKSNLKMLEAGFMDCAVMVSGVDPYLPLATSANSFLLSEKNFYEWAKYILKNPSIIGDKKSQLKEDVKPYSLDILSVKRKQIYESLI